MRLFHIVTGSSHYHEATSPLMAIQLANMERGRHPDAEIVIWEKINGEWRRFTL